jgi:hypothetical protein
MPLVPVLRAGATIVNQTTGTEIASAGSVATVQAEGTPYQTASITLAVGQVVPLASVTTGLA